MERLRSFRGSLVRESGLAYLAEIDGMDEPVWLPKSASEFDPETHTFEVEEWLAREKDLP